MSRAVLADVGAMAAPLGFEEGGPGGDLGVLAQEGAALALGHTAPHTELHTVVEGIGAAFELDRAVPTDRRGFSLSRPAHEQLVRVFTSTLGLRNPCLSRFGFPCGQCRWRHYQIPVYLEDQFTYRVGYATAGTDCCVGHTRRQIYVCGS